MIPATLRRVEIEDKPMGPWKEFFLRFFSNKTAMVFAIIFALFMLAILFAPVWLDYVWVERQAVGSGHLSPGSRVEISYFDEKTLTQITEWRTYIFGTDQQGRDYFARVIYGTRSALSMAFTIIIASAVLGTLVGSVSGYFGGKIDFFIMRAVDVLLSIPGILLAMAIAASLGQSTTSLILALTISRVPAFARVIRSTTLSLKNMEYIEAAHAVGTPTYKIIGKHIIPNTLSPIIVQVTLGLAGVMLSLSGLAFLGFGLPAPAPDLGGLIAAGRGFFNTHMFLINIPGLFIVYIILTFNILGDAFRDALDPKLRD